jgi:hypothetical protein
MWKFIITVRISSSSTAIFQLSVALPGTCRTHSDHSRRSRPAGCFGAIRQSQSSQRDGMLSQSPCALTITSGRRPVDITSGDGRAAATRGCRAPRLGSMGDQCPQIRHDPQCRHAFAPRPTARLSRRQALLQRREHSPFRFAQAPFGPFALFALHLIGLDHRGNAGD